MADKKPRTEADIVGRADAESLFLSDEPITSAGQDELKRSKLASEIARQIVLYPAPDNLVIAINGPWGCGKTSLLNLVVERLPKEAEENRKDEPIVVWFRPWDASNHAQLERLFFTELFSQLNRQAKSAQLRRVADAIRVFQGVLSVLELVGMPSALGKGAEVAANAIDKRAQQGESVEAARREVANALEYARRRILVIVDDIDRLDADEIRTVFKLVKSTANFPYVMYLLAFDPAIVASVLDEQRTKISGRAFLEKIVQMPISVPIPDPYVHESTLRTLIEGALSVVPASSVDLSSWRSLYHVQGFPRLMPTLRAMKRFANGLKFQLELVQREVDPIDFIALEAIRQFAPDVYAELPARKQLFLYGTSTDYFATSKDAATAELRRILDQVRGPNADVIRNLLLFLFPKAAALLGRTEAGESPKKAFGDLRIQSPGVFERYFLLGVPTKEVPRAEAERLLGDHSGEPLDGAAIRGAVSTWFDLGAHRSLIAHLSALAPKAHPVHPEHVKPLVLALLEESDKLVCQPEFVDLGFLHEVAQTCYIILSAISNPNLRLTRAAQTVKEARAFFSLAFFAELATSPRGTRRVVSPNQLESDSASMIRAEFVARARKMQSDPEQFFAVPDLAVFILKRLRTWGTDQLVSAVLQDMLRSDERFVMLARCLVKEVIGDNTRWELISDAVDFLDLTSAKQRAALLLSKGDYQGRDLAALQLLAQWEPDITTHDDSASRSPSDTA